MDEKCALQPGLNARIFMATISEVENKKNAG